MSDIQHQEPSSSFADTSMTEFDANNVDSILGLQLSDGAGGSSSSIVAQARRPRPKITPELIVSKKGLPYIRAYKSKIIKNLDKSSKPSKNLANFLRTYQLWAHNLFPRAKFRDFTEMIGKYGSSTLVRTFREEWIMEDMGSFQESIQNNSEFQSIRNVLQSESLEVEPLGGKSVPETNNDQPNSSLSVHGDNDYELYTTATTLNSPKETILPIDMADEELSANEERKSKPVHTMDNLDDFSNVQNQLFNTNESSSGAQAQETNKDIPDLDDFEQSHFQDEFDILNEMGL